MKRMFTAFKLAVFCQGAFVCYDCCFPWEREERLKEIRSAFVVEEVDPYGHWVKLK